MQLNEVIRLFEVERQISATSYQVKCPAHSDQHASLTISEEDGKILMFCHAGCPTEEIVAAVGLTMAELGDKPAQHWQEKLEGFVKKPLIDYYHYKDEAGRYLFTKLRFRESDGSKAIRYGTLDKQQDFMKLGKSGKKGSLYNLPALLKAVKSGFPVHYVEGEKDVETMKKIGLTATTAGGAKDWKREYARYFIGAKVMILPDNDEPGQALGEQVRRDLRDFAHSVKLVTLSEREHGDVSDYIEEGHDKEDLLERIQQEPAVVAPWIYFNKLDKDHESPKVNVGILAECIYKHNHMFIARNPGTESDLIYWYEKGVYRLLSKTELIGMVVLYLPSSIATPATLRNVADVMTYSCQTMDFLNVNQNERYINVKNGLYDIQAKTLIPHTPEIISTIQLNCSYPENYRTPDKWAEFLHDFCTDEEGQVDFEMMDLLQEWAGFLLSNIPGYRLKKCLVLYSALGGTGKSVFLSVIAHLLGQKNTTNVSFQQMDRSRWATGNIYGKRGVLVGDQSSEDIQDSSIFKQLTGGDMVSAELKGKQSFSYRFNGCIVAACNNLPVFQDDKGGHMFDRLSLIHCRNTISKKQQDRRLVDKLLLESDQIFRWALEGLHRLIEHRYRFTECKSSDALMKDYRGRIDSLFRFIQDNCLITENKMDRILKTLLESEYAAYCEANQCKPIGKKSLPVRFAKLGVPLVPYDGYPHYRKIKWLDFRKWSDDAKF